MLRSVLPVDSASRVGHWNFGEPGDLGSVCDTGVHQPFEEVSCGHPG